MSAALEKSIERFLEFFDDVTSHYLQVAIKSDTYRNVQCEYINIIYFLSI